MAESFRVYIDESGDEGFGFGHGTSSWFILSAVVGRVENDPKDSMVVDHVRTLLKKPPRKQLHFRDLKHEQKLPYCDEIAKTQFRTVSVLIHKPSLTAPETFQEKSRLYFYGVRYLLERVSWVCRDGRRNNDPNNGTAVINFSNRSGMKYDDLRDYMDRLKAKAGVRIDWKVIKSTQIEAHSVGKRMALQVADAVAGSHYRALEPDTYGHHECRYVQILGPRAYRHRGICLGYGVKFWPPEGKVIADGCGDWGWSAQEPAKK